LSDAIDQQAQRAHLARVVAELIAVRRARLLSMLVLAAAMLVAGLGAALQAQGEHIDAVLLFSAFSLIMIGIVCALAAIIAWTRLNRDVLDSVAAAPPARARAPRTRTAGMVVAIGFAILGALFAILLWDRTPILAAAVVIACALLACLGPIWAGELASADDRLAVILDSDDELSERLSTFTPIWLHEAMGAEETRRNRS
jgi:mannose/fructose/N-acetylgalactosamine-specific phosphotransferase system component IIC